MNTVQGFEGTSPLPAPSSVGRLLQAAAALPLLLLAGWLVWDYPLGRAWLAVLLLALAVYQWLRPTAWLIALPALLPVLELAPWSGRLLLDEFDAVLAALAAVALLRGHYAGGLRQLLRRSYLPIWLLGLALLVGLYRGLVPAGPLDANAWSGYLTQWNALRVGKGELWALLYAPLLTTQLAGVRARVEQDFTLGMVLGAALFGVAVLWERGFFLDLMTAHSIWGLVEHWLNLTARYRITGLFSQMHFGGAAVDGYIVLVWPFGLLLLLKARHPALAALGGITLALSAYACLATFTRTTYLAVPVGGLVGLTPLLRGMAQRGGIRGALMPVPVLVSMAAATLVGFRYGGVLVLMAAVGVGLGAGLAGYLGPRFRPMVRAGALSAVLLAGLALALKGILGSQYHHTGFPVALLVAGGLALLVGLGSWLLGNWGRQWLDPRAACVGLFAVVLIVPVIALGLGGARMETRLGSAAGDLQGRLRHWQSVLDLASGDLQASLLGQGMGHYPLAYLMGPAGGKEGAYTWAGGTLRFTGSAALHLGQRLTHWTPGRYRVLVRYRVLAGAPTLYLRLARRPLLVQEWFGQKADARLKPGGSPGQWRQAETWLDASRLAPPRWYQPDFSIFSLWSEGRGEGLLEVDSIRLLDSGGRDLLHNGDFATGGDRWFAYNDYEHLAWHAKNLFLIVWFDQGLLGLAALLLMLLPALVRLARRARYGERFPLALLAAMGGFLVLGLTATLFDVPRITLLFWLLAIMGLYRQRYRRGEQMVTGSAPVP